MKNIQFDFSNMLAAPGGLTCEDIRRETGKLARVREALRAGEADMAWRALPLSQLAGIQDIGSAKLGDKTLLDTLIPGVEAYSVALDAGKGFQDALTELQAAAKAGWQSTEGMIAKIGRASRLGERSRGVLDAGATSCYLILNAMADSVLSLLAASK